MSKYGYNVKARFNNFLLDEVYGSLADAHRTFAEVAKEANCVELYSLDIYGRPTILAHITKH